MAFWSFEPETRRPRTVARGKLIDVIFSGGKGTLSVAPGSNLYPHFRRKCRKLFRHPPLTGDDDSEVHRRQTLSWKLRDKWSVLVRIKEATHVLDKRGHQFTLRYGWWTEDTQSFSLCLFPTSKFRMIMAVICLEVLESEREMYLPGEEFQNADQKCWKYTHSTSTCTLKQNATKTKISTLKSHADNPSTK